METTNEVVFELNLVKQELSSNTIKHFRQRKDQMLRSNRRVIFHMLEEQKGGQRTQIVNKEKVDRR
jgi:hypothetical protein